MKKIYFITMSMAGGGAERVIVHLLNNLSRNKFKITLILFKKEGPNLKLIKNDIKIVNLNCPKVMIGIFKLMSILIKDKPDILFSSLGPLNAVISPFLCFLKKTKKIARETNIPSYIHSMKIHQGIYKYYLIKILYKTFYKKYNIIVAQSDDMKNDLIKNYGFKENKVVKINNPIDFDFLSLKTQTNYKNPLSNDKLNMVSAGRLTYQKGIDLLLEQMAKIKSEDIELTILGEGELEEQLKAQVKKLGLEKKVSFLGYKENPYIYFKSSDIFVLPSRIEGFPNVALENLGLGKPIIANNFKGGINEIIVSGLNGKIIDYSKDNFEEAIKEVVKYKKNSKKIIENAKKKYAKDKIIKKYESILE